MRFPPGSPFPKPALVVLPSNFPPVLCVIVDAEEEFFWDRPFGAKNNSTASIKSQQAAHRIFGHYGVRPIYLATYPLASQPSAVSVLREYQVSRLCDIGAQLHPWVTPPFPRAAGDDESYPSNLPAGVERDKIIRLVDAIQTNFHVQPTVYKAGRYGFGPNTAELLEEAGFQIDTSLIPRTSYRESGGPNFAAYDYRPFWFGRRRRLLELPVTRAVTGLVSQSFPSLHDLSERQPFRRFRLGGLLARSGLLERITLSPEGTSLKEMCRLTRALLARGVRIFTLSYHSPSLEPGNTPYVRTQRDLAVFLDSLSGFLSFFQNEVGGAFLTVNELRDSLVGKCLPAHPGLEGQRPSVTPLPTQGARCLVVANTFPPIHGGSSIVYDSLARFGQGRVSVLASTHDFRNGYPLQGWREFDQQAPFSVRRIRLLRTTLTAPSRGTLRRFAFIASDLAIRLRVCWEICKASKQERVSTVCVGDLVGSGWLPRVCRLLGLKAIIYVHGEEITTRTSYDADGKRRKSSLRHAAGIVAVSRFTAETLSRAMGVPSEKIRLISNGVDLGRFHPRSKKQDLIARYGLAGKTVVLTVGRLCPRKGMDRVIESLPRLVTAVTDLAYLVVGDGPYRAQLEAIAVQMGVRDHVVFAGAVTDGELADHYALGDIFVMANREMPDGDTEGFGLVFLEANACGIPVIAGKAGGSVDAVTDGLNGILVDGDDPNDIAVAIEKLAADPVLRERLVAQGLEVAAKSGWAVRVDQFLELCDRCSKKS